ncbi:Gustatory receptor 145e [Halyomorpha halys]|nr:Gustatory receptor 145e [Halyomorpha halys]
MNRRKPRNVFEEVDKCSLVLKPVGLFTLIHSSGEFTSSWKWFILSFVTMWPFLFYSIYINYFRWQRDDMSLKMSLDLARGVSLVLCVSIMWLRNRTRLSSLNRCLKKIQIVDYYLFSVGEQVPPAKLSKVILLAIGAMVFAYIVWVHRITRYQVWMNVFAVFFPYISMSMIHLLLDRLFTMLFMRYQAVTNVVRRCFSLQGKKAAVLLEKMVFCYENLCSSGESIDYFFSLQILLILTVVFLISFSEVYAIIQLLYANEFRFYKNVTTITHVSWVFISILTIWRFGYRFSSIAEKADEFNSLLFRLMMEDKSNEILYNEKLMVHFAMKREVVFTACGLFRLDYTLVHSMIASATTYLVLLIQFGKLSPDGVEAPTTPTYNNFTTEWSNATY